MTEEVVKKQHFTWIHLMNPTFRELAEVSIQFDLPNSLVNDCLEPEHLPKLERIGKVTFIIMRAFDDRSTSDADTIRKLTNKVAIFVGKGFLITIQRRDHEYMRILRNKWRVKKQDKNNSFKIINDIFTATLQSFDEPIFNATEAVEAYEEDIFKGKNQEAIIQAMYLLRRRGVVYKKILFMTRDIFAKINYHYPQKSSVFQDNHDKVIELNYYAEQLVTDANDLLNIHLALASHRTNEVMRVLTILSAFFLPLTFLVGVYGMNFKHMPELSSTYGYAIFWGLTIAMVLTIFLLFKKQGWLDN